MTMMFVDPILAERLEEAEAFAAESYVRRLALRRPGVDVAVEDVAGGRAVFESVRERKDRAYEG